MAKKVGVRRERGHIRLRGNSYQVLVYAGIDPFTGKELRLTASTTGGAEAERILKRFRAQGDEQRHARTKATFRAAMKTWLRVHEIEETDPAGLRVLHGAVGSDRRRATVGRVTQQQYQLGDRLPPLAPPDASDDERGRAIEARMVARHGAPSIEDYRRAYASFGAAWPGDEEIRRRHLVAPESAV